MTSGERIIEGIGRGHRTIVGLAAYSGFSFIATNAILNALVSEGKVKQVGTAYILDKGDFRCQ